MKVVTTAQMRELDRRTIEEADITGEELMERAGGGVAGAVQHLAEIAGFNRPFVLLVAGRGNNGGDAFAAARHLKEWGADAEVWLAGAANEIKGDALKHLSRMRAAHVPLRELPTKEDWEDAAGYRAGADILVDGVLGTGAAGPARGPAVGAIEFINMQSRDSLVVAIDLPSGLDADTGQVNGAAVLADLTVTIGLPKTGLMAPAALDYVGCIEVVDIGIPPAFVEQAGPDPARELIYSSDLRGLFPRRPRAAHKGRFGHVLLIGGARGYAGAITLAARAALRGGAGLVTVLTPEEIAPVVAAASLETMVIGVPATEQGAIAPEVWQTWRARADEFNAVLVGPGLTRHDSSLQLVRQIIRECSAPLVLDADALSVMEGQAHRLGNARRSLVITPHPGEMARLLMKKTEDIQANRFAAAREAAEQTQGVVVLKGAGTVVTQPGAAMHVNLTGNPGMATGGTGDVLAGLLTSFIGQGLNPFDAARAAVYIHGRAGDMAAWRKSQAGLIAGDLIEELPFALRDLTLR